MINLSGRQAFSVVELSIVIVVVGILATVTLVAYPQLQNTARDGKIREGATKIAQATQEWALRTNQTPKTANSGYGSTGSVIVDSNGNTTCAGGSGSGWVASGRDSNHPCTIEDLLVSGDFLPQGYLSNLPSNPKTKNFKDNYYLTYCYNDTRFYALIYTLRSPTSEDSDEYTRVINECGVGSHINDTFKSYYQMGSAMLVRMAD